MIFFLFGTLRVIGPYIRNFWLRDIANDDTNGAVHSKFRPKVQKLDFMDFSSDDVNRPVQLNKLISSLNAYAKRPDQH